MILVGTLHPYLAKHHRIDILFCSNIMCLYWFVVYFFCLFVFRDAY